MDTWTLAVVTALLCLASAAAFFRRLSAGRRLPPGPPPLPIIGNLLPFLLSGGDFLSYLEKLFSEYGPIISIQLRSVPTVVVADRDIAHEMLVQNAAIFADRPPPTAAGHLLTAGGCQVSAAAYGPRWRLLRRNLASEILSPGRARQCAAARQWTLQIILDGLRSAAAVASDGVVVPKDVFQYAMFCLLVFLCFGEKLEEKTVREIEKVQRDLLLFFQKLAVFNIAPAITRYLFWRRWRRFRPVVPVRSDIFLPLIRSRRQKSKSSNSEEDSLGFSYLDSILNLEIPDEAGRKLNDEEVVSLCSEFLNGGTDTTSTALEWIMANITKNPAIQERLAEEVGASTSEEELASKTYLKAVILEGLRRHPPGHFVLPHATTEEVTVQGYTIPKGAAINFAVGKIGRDERHWADPLEFRPDRFIGRDTDITGNRKIDMMPFGVGRRICPGMGLALLHLEYFVANLVGEFKWDPADGDEIDLSEKPEFTVVMKKPLRCCISARF